MPINENTALVNCNRIHAGSKQSTFLITFSGRLVVFNTVLKFLALYARFVAIIAVVWVEKSNQKWADLTVSCFACCQLTINCSSRWLSGTSYIIQVRDLHIAVSSNRSSLNINIFVNHLCQLFSNSASVVFKWILFNMVSY